MALAQPIPKGHNTLTAHLIVDNCAKAITFYEKAFGAKELARMAMPGGRIGHAEMQIGDSIFMLADEFPEMHSKGPKSYGGSPVTIHMYVPNADETYQRAVKAGATATMPMADMFWGDRYGRVKDPFGHEWSIATHVKDVSLDEMTKAAQAAYAKPMAKH
jgi:PhnB protein